MSNHFANHSVCIQSEKIGEHSADIVNLKCWQQDQNGQLKKLGEKLDELQSWVISILGMLVLNLLLLILKK